jgi:hypothetical protein
MTALTVLEIMRPGGDRYTTHLVVGFTTPERRARVATVGTKLPVPINPDKPGKIAIDAAVLFGQQLRKFAPSSSCCSPARRQGWTGSYSSG